MDQIDIYSKGLVHCSVCAPVGMEPKDVETAVNAVHPTGIESQWSISDDAFFRDGTTRNGGIVECHNGRTRHWLLVC